MSDEFARQFVDTNILVYAYDISAGVKHELAESVLQSLWESRNGCLSIQVLQEFYVTVTRKILQPLSSAQALQIVTDLGSWRIHKPDVEDVIGAIQLQGRYDLSFWDAMVVHSANQLGCHILWSEDLNTGQVYQQARVQSPFQV